MFALPPRRVTDHSHNNNAMVRLRIGFGEHIFTIPVSAYGQSVVKLADFGTSAVGAAALGDPIDTQQFTTLENTPPEYLICGSTARQAFSADTFPLGNTSYQCSCQYTLSTYSLTHPVSTTFVFFFLSSLLLLLLPLSASSLSVGLCMLHLLTGQEPYEELLQDIRCPAYLKQELASHWETSDTRSPYYVIGESNGQRTQNKEHTLPHTLSYTPQIHTLTQSLNQSISHASSNTPSHTSLHPHTAPPSFPPSLPPSLPPFL